MAEDFGRVWLHQQNSPHLAKPETGAKIMFVLLPSCLGARDHNIFFMKRASKQKQFATVGKVWLAWQGRVKACSTAKRALH